MTDDISNDKPTLRHRLRLGGRTGQALAAILLLGLGAAGGAGAVSATRPGVEMAPAQPVAIASLAGRTGIVTVRGRVAEIYGGRFTVQDESGRTLVDTGPRALDGIAPGTQVSVQGRVDDGVLHASFLVGADGNVTPLGPAHGGPGHGPGPHGPHGEGPGPQGCGPDAMAAAPPPPAASQNGVAPAAPAPVAR